MSDKIYYMVASVYSSITYPTTLRSTRRAALVAWMTTEASPTTPAEHLAQLADDELYALWDHYVRACEVRYVRVQLQQVADE